MPTLGLYLHIPFCRSKCLYCDFCSIPHAAEERMVAYADAMERDLLARAEDCRDDTVDTVYFGGGTPTCLPPEVLCGFLATVLSRYNVAENAEITTECNPGTVTPGDLVKLREGGFNRLSMGLQSAQAGELRALGRLHSFADFAETFRAARAAGFANLSADVMFGIPHQTAESFADTLEKLCDLRPDHVSAYALTVEEGTPFGRRGAAALNLPDEEAVREMYLGMVEFLGKRGLAQYEISNFARPGHEGRHNLLYWNCNDYWGIGPAAHSCVDNVRRFWPGDVQGFIDGTIHEEIEGDCTAEDYLLMQLRLTCGLDLEEYARRGGHFTAAQQAFMRQCVTHGYAVWEGSSFRLTPAGMVVQNAILTELI